jgi:hypothetical protein
MKTPKFNVGDKVHCYREETDEWFGFDFKGKVLSVNIIDDDVEYTVSNAPRHFFGPLLIWEEEMNKV